MHQRVRRYAETTLRLADNFVHLARLENQTAECEPVDIADAMAQAIDAVWPQANSIGIAIDRQAAQREDLWALGDAAALVRAFVNLLSNAVQASPQGSAIRCAVARDGDHVLASVCDEGPGLPPARKADPFARFGYTRLSSGARGSGWGSPMLRRWRASAVAKPATPKGRAAARTSPCACRCGKRRIWVIRGLRDFSPWSALR
jgi:signal transduction histidine kinase